MVSSGQNSVTARTAARTIASHCQLKGFRQGAKHARRRTLTCPTVGRNHKLINPGNVRPAADWGRCCVFPQRSCSFGHACHAIVSSDLFPNPLYSQTNMTHVHILVAYNDPSPTHTHKKTWTNQTRDQPRTHSRRRQLLGSQERIASLALSSSGSKSDCTGDPG